MNFKLIFFLGLISNISSANDIFEKDDLIINNNIFSQKNDINTRNEQKIFLEQRKYAMQLYNKVRAGDISAVEELQQSAEIQNNRWSAMQLGFLFHTGQLPKLNNKPDINQAIKAYNMACNNYNKFGRVVNINGNYLAAYNLGIIYYYSQNLNKALKYFKVSLGFEDRKSFYPAAVFIALILEKLKNNKEALKYWKIAADKKEDIALYHLGNSLLTGKNGIKNPYEGLPLLIRAAQRWNINAMIELANFYQTGDKFRESNRVEALKYLMIASTINPKLNIYVDKLLSSLRKVDQKRAMALAGSWLSAHGNVPEPIDYHTPLNDDPPIRR